MSRGWGSNVEGSADNTALRVVDVSIIGDNRWATSGAGGGSWQAVRAGDALEKTSGKWWFRVKYQRFVNSNVFVGVTDDTALLGSDHTKANVACFYLNDGEIWASGAPQTSGGTTVGSGTATQQYWVDVFVDIDTRQFWVAVDGVLPFGGNPAAGTGENFLIPGTGAMRPAMEIFNYDAGQTIVELNKSFLGDSPHAGFRAFGDQYATLTDAGDTFLDIDGRCLGRSNIALYAACGQ